MLIRIFQIQAEFYKVDKSADMVNILEMTGTLRAPSSVLDPVITVHLPYSVEQGANTLGRYNMAYVYEFHRFYFIREIQVGENGLATLYLHVDALWSYADVIKAGKGYVKRNENATNLSLIDPLVKFGNVREVSYSAVTSSVFNADFTFDYSLAQNYPCIAVTVYLSDDRLADFVNEHPNAFPSQIPANTWVKLQYLLGRTSYAVADGVTRQPDRVHPSNQITYLMTPLQWRAFQSEVKFKEGMETGFVSAVALPCIIDLTNPNQQNRFANVVPYQFRVYCNNDAVDTSSTYLQSCAVSAGGSVSNMFKAGEIVLPPIPDFTYVEPFTTYEIFLPFVGMVSLPSSAIFGSTLEIWYEINLLTGEGTVYLYKVKSASPREIVEVYSASCRIGTRLSIDSSNEKENDISRQSNALNTAVGLVASAVAVGTGIATGNPVATVGGVLSAGKAIAGAVNGEMHTIDRANVSLSSPEAGWFASLTPFMKATRLPPVTTRNADFAKRYGLPVEQYQSISALSGFTVFDEIELPSDGTMMKPEHDEIESLMKTGVIL